MDTRIYDVRGKDPEKAEEIREAAQMLKDGGIVAFPTETVYGLGAVALDAAAVAKIYEAKGRPTDNPMIVHIRDFAELEALTNKAGSEVELLAKAFWPGPLTIILPKKDLVPDITTGGLKTVAIRMPDSKVALELIRQVGKPLAAPSANISGRPSPTKGEHVEKDLAGRVHGIVIGEDCRVGIESTVLDMSDSIPIILRPGTITAEEIKGVLGREVLTGSDSEPGSPKSPGTKYTHYSPKAEMLILQGEKDLVFREIDKIKSQKAKLKIGIIDMGDKTTKEAAKVLFGELRKKDEENVDLIIAIAPRNQDSVGFALMNRMLKAAGNNFRLIEE